MIILSWKSCYIFVGAIRNIDGTLEFFVGSGNYGQWNLKIRNIF